MIYGLELCNVSEGFHTRQDNTQYSDVEDFDHIGLFPYDYSNEFSEFDDERNENPLLDNSLSFENSVNPNDAETNFINKTGDCFLYRNAPLSIAESSHYTSFC